MTQQEVAKHLGGGGVFGFVFENLFLFMCGTSLPPPPLHTQVRHPQPPTPYVLLRAEAFIQTDNERYLCGWVGLCQDNGRFVFANKNLAIERFEK